MTHGWRQTGLMLLCVMSAHCARHIPDHLLTTPPPTSQIDISTAVHPLDALLRTDRWARYLLDDERTALWAQVPTEAQLAVSETLEDIEQRQADPAVALWRLERSWPATPLVPLTRAYRTRWADARWAMHVEGPDTATDPNVALLTNLTPGRPLPPGSAPAWSWLSPSTPDRAQIQHYADLWTLRGWMQHPKLQIHHVARGLSEHGPEPLLSSDESQWILHRAASTDASCASGTTSAWDTTIEATSLALERAAADRDHEQAAWSDHRAQLQKRLQTSEDPIDVLLNMAWANLLDCAHRDREAGLALLVLEARRWNRGCTHGCDGLDRMRGFETAGTWHPEVLPIAHSWRALAIKESIDTMDVGHDTVLFPVALYGLINVVAGLRGEPVSASLLQLRTGEELLWNQLGGHLGHTDATDWYTVKLGLLEQLHREATLASREAPPALRERLSQIAEGGAP